MRPEFGSGLFAGAPGSIAFTTSRLTVLPPGRMSIAARYGLAAELGSRYRAAGRVERVRILDAYCQATGYNRRYGMEMLRGRLRKPELVRRSRQRRYGDDFAQALGVLWEAAGHICGERLQPFLPELVPLLERHGHLDLDDGTRDLIVSASVATVERVLAALRSGPVSQPCPPWTGSGRPRSLPIRAGDLQELCLPGFLEVDLHRHDGGGVEVPAWTMVAVDLCSGWTERVAVRSSPARAALMGGLDHVRGQLPFRLRGLVPGRGWESATRILEDYCRGEARTRPPIVFSPRQRQDTGGGAHLSEQVVRLVDSLNGVPPWAYLDWLNGLYADLLRPYCNLFQPVMRLVAKEVVNGQHRRRHDSSATPLRRVIGLGVADRARLAPMLALHDSLCPLDLKRQIDHRLSTIPDRLVGTAG